ncbi:MAG: tail fiber domain-containing protein, partial [Magnetococcus sp. YQC-5]
SDIKLKENITDTTPKLEKLLQVQIRNFNLIGNPLPLVGVIAQELELICPSLVEDVPDFEMIPDSNWIPGNGQTESDRPYIQHFLGTITKSVKYSVFVPMLIKALQEFHAEHTALESRVAALEAN